MTLDEVLLSSDPARMRELSPDDLTRLFWKMKGLRKQVERDGAFWSSTNQNLKTAYEHLDEKERELARAYNIIRDDLEVAQQVQRALLPRPFPEMEAELELSVYHKQLTEVGGDYYDFFRTREGAYAIGVFDISGHGVSAALIMSFLKAQFTHAMNTASGAKGIVEHVNAAVYEFLREVRRYATVNFVLFEKQAIRYVSGGGYGLLVRGNEATSFGKADSFIGLRQRPYHEFDLPFGPGDILALYTDGIVEAQDREGADYTVRRLNELIVANASRPTEEILKRCVDDYTAFRHADGDDITLMILRRRRP